MGVPASVDLTSVLQERAIEDIPMLIRGTYLIDLISCCQARVDDAALRCPKYRLRDKRDLEMTPLHFQSNSLNTPAYLSN